MSKNNVQTFSHLKKDKINNTLTFSINNIDVGIVNALRRIILSEIPNVAIPFDSSDPDKSQIDFVENTTCLHNEMLGHRISLLPINLDEKTIENFDQDDYNFEINVHNTSHEMLDVTTHDIMILDKEGNNYSTKIQKHIFPDSPLTGDPILIIVLNPNHYNTNFGDKLHVRFQANLGLAKDHSRYSPVSTCAFSNVQDETKTAVAREEVVKKAQELITHNNIENKDGVQTILTDKDKNEIRKRFNVHDAQRFFKTNEYDEANVFQFVIESECRMRNEYIFKKAFEVLISKIDSIITEKRFNVTKLDNNYYSVLIRGEQHTIGNLFHVLFYNVFLREKKELNYVGYHLVHPLVEEIIMKFKFNENILKDESDEGNDIQEMKTYFIQGLKHFKTILEDLRIVWIEESNINDGKKENKSSNLPPKKIIRKVMKPK
jgi:DNA-directed RNA polymerase subunit L